MSEGNDAKLKAYMYWYRLAEEVLGTLIPHLDDREFGRLIPKRTNWFAIPLSSETEIKEVANRPQPHIDFKILEEGKIRIGLRCNTVTSVEKMMNILDECQSVERQEFIKEIKMLDDDFQTQVLSKIKETNFAQIPEYECKLKLSSNKIDDKQIHQVFETVKEIREEGKRRLKEEALSRLNPETPVLDIAFTVIKQDPAIFKNKLHQMKRMYQICLNVKTSSELRAQKKKMQQTTSQWVIKFVCPKCGKEFAPDPSKKMRFCEDGMRIIEVKQKMNSPY